MIIDTSALIAIINRDPGYQAVEDALVRADEPKIGAPTQLEAGMVALARYGHRGTTLLARLLQEQAVTVVPFTAQHTEIAADAFNRFGKGRHKASLNFGDCMTYATAYVAREPLLFVGEDFIHTDLALIDLSAQE